MSVRRRLQIGIFIGFMSGAAAAAQLGLEGTALAAGKPKVAVGGFSNDKNGDVRDAFLSALRRDGSYELTDAEDVKPTANTKAVADAAKAMEVSVIITGRVVGSTLKLKIMGADGRQLEAPEIKGPSRAKLKTNVQNTASTSVADGVDSAIAAERAANQKEEPAEKDEEPKAKAEAEAEVEAEADDDQGPGLSPLDFTAGMRGMHRTFTFNQTIAELRPNDGFDKFLTYKLPLGPVAFIDLNWYPGAHFSKGQAARIGISAGYEKGFAISTEYKPSGGAKRTLSTNEQAFYVGARYRLPLGAHELGLAGIFGQHTFELTGDESLPLVPDVKYTYIKVGLDGTLRFGDVSVGARVGKRFVTKTGALETVWFPGAVSTQSLEAGVTVGYRLLPALEVVAGFDWLRYAFDFNGLKQRPGAESLVAGGAVDQYWSGSLGIRVRIPGSGESQPAAAKSAPASDDDAKEDE